MSWNLRDPELNQVWHKIIQAHVPDIHAQSADTWTWSPTKTGQFEFSSAWDYGLIWFPNNSLKMSTCILRAIKRKLPIRAFLKELNIIDSDQCLLSNMASETIPSLFFEWSLSSYVWQLCRLKWGYHWWYNWKIDNGSIKNPEQIQKEGEAHHPCKVCVMCSNLAHLERKKRERFST